MSNRGLAVAAGLLADRALGEPPTGVHPVAWFGRTMQGVETVVWADRRANGVAYAAVGVGLGAGVGKLGRSTAIAVGLVAAGRQLRETAAQIGEATAEGDVAAARAQLPSLVGRDPTELDAAGITAAVIESVAENSVDAVIAPAFWAAVAGAPGAGAYRAINTMDAMVGHRSDRYRNFGWAAARLDDAANYLPARMFALLVALQVPSRAAAVLATVRRDARAHPSPNAGVAEAAVAGSIGCELGGPLRYGMSAEDRPTLGDGARPTPADVGRVIEIANRAELAAVGALAVSSIVSILRRRK